MATPLLIPLVIRTFCFTRTFINAVPFSSPNVLSMTLCQGIWSRGIVILPFHFGSKRSCQDFGTSAGETSFVLYIIMTGYQYKAV